MEEPTDKMFLEDQVATIAETKEYEVLALEVMPDHVHLFVSAPPFGSPTEMVKGFKGVTALRRARETYIVSVDKMRRGYAEVTVGDGEKATMLAEEYDGPSGLLRKGARFRAVAEVSGRKGNRYIWVKEVVEVLERR